MCQKSLHRDIFVSVAVVLAFLFFCNCCYIFVPRFLLLLLHFVVVAFVVVVFFVAVPFCYCCIFLRHFCCCCCIFVVAVVGIACTIAKCAKNTEWR